MKIVVICLFPSESKTSPFSIQILSLLSHVSLSELLRFRLQMFSFSEQGRISTDFQMWWFFLSDLFPLTAYFKSLAYIYIPPGTYRDLFYFYLLTFLYHSSIMLGTLTSASCNINNLGDVNCIGRNSKLNITMDKRTLWLRGSIAMEDGHPWGLKRRWLL